MRTNKFSYEYDNDDQAIGDEEEIGIEKVNIPSECAIAIKEPFNVLGNNASFY